MKARIQLLLFFSLLCLLKSPAQEEQVVFSNPGGFYEDSFPLHLYCFYPNHHIRYTTNGEMPTVASPRYEEALCLDESLYSKSDIYTIQVTIEEEMFYPDQVEKCIVIRAAVFDEEEHCISPTTTNTYFIGSLGNNSYGLPMVSICADSLDLFDYERGILVPGITFDPNNPKWSGNYHQRGRDWERTVNIEFYETDNTGINQVAGLRTHGYVGRLYQQKNLAVYAREEYGKKRFKHRFFESLDIDSFKHLTLKPFRCAWTSAGVQDPLCQTIASQFPNVESLATRPVMLYINGEYWGIYFLHEKPDERHLESHFDIGIDECDILNNWIKCEHGNCNDFIRIISELETIDLSDEMEYNRINDIIDLDSFIDYEILEMFLGNTDWPANNVRCWRLGNGKWRWIFYDADACLISTQFDVFENATYYGNSDYPASLVSTVLLRRLLANESFRDHFLNRFQELLLSHFNPTETIPLLHELEHQLQGAIPSQARRFGTPIDDQDWAEQCDNIEKFLRQRPELIAQQLKEFIKAESWNMGEWLCYPNPASEMITLSFHTNESRQELISVFDITGKQVYTSEVDIHSGANVIPVNPALSPGLYFLTIGKIRQKIIIL